MWGSGLGQHRGLAATMSTKTLDFQRHANRGWAKVSSGSRAIMSGPVETVPNVPLQPHLTSGNNTPVVLYSGLTLFQGSSPSESL